MICSLLVSHIFPVSTVENIVTVDSVVKLSVWVDVASLASLTHLTLLALVKHSIWFRVVVKLLLLTVLYLTLVVELQRLLRLVLIIKLLLRRRSHLRWRIELLLVLLLWGNVLVLRRLVLGNITHWGLVIIGVEGRCCLLLVTVNHWLLSGQIFRLTVNNTSSRVLLTLCSLARHLFVEGISHGHLVGQTSVAAR
jgi:hypothetical protein